MRKHLTFPLMLAVVALAGCASSRVTTRAALQVSQAPISATSPALMTLYGGKANNYLRSLHCDSSGCTLYGRTGGSFTPDEDFLVIRTEASGQPVWVRAYGGTSTDNLRSAITTRDGGALLVGYSHSLFYTSLKVFSPHKWPRPFLVRIDAHGKLQWSETINLSGSTWRLRLSGGIETADGGFLLAGFYEDWTDQLNRVEKTCLNMSLTGTNCRTRPENPPQDAILIRLDSTGKIKWLKRYRVSDAKYAHNSKTWTVLPGRDGRFLAALYDGSDTRAILLTIDGGGTPLSAKTLEGLGNSGPSDFVALTEGGYLFVGRDYGESGAVAATFVARIDQDGQLVDVRRYAQNDFTSLKLVKAGDGQHYCIAGRNGKGAQSRGAALLFSLDNNSSRIFALHANVISEFFDVTSDPKGGCLIGGSTGKPSADNFDILTFHWQPKAASNKGPDGESVADAHLTKIDVSVIEQEEGFTDSLAHFIPNDDIRVTTIPVVAPQSSAGPASAQMTSYRP